jgi:hypothetical protein
MVGTDESKLHSLMPRFCRHMPRETQSPSHRLARGPARLVCSPSAEARRPRRLSPSRVRYRGGGGGANSSASSCRKGTRASASACS